MLGFTLMLMFNMCLHIKATRMMLWITRRARKDRWIFLFFCDFVLRLLVLFTLLTYLKSTGGRCCMDLETWIE